MVSHIQKSGKIGITKDEKKEKKQSANSKVLTES